MSWRTSDSKTQLVQRVTLACCIAAGSVSFVDADEVSVRNDDGTIWVMQIEPAKALASPVVPTASDAEAANSLPAVAPQEETRTTVTAAKPVAELPLAPPAPMPLFTSPRVISDFGMTIIPRGSEPHADMMSRYETIYASIPFNRAEYVANPSYRHDATMQLLTGQPQPGGGKTGQILRTRKYTGYRPYLPSRTDSYYRFRYRYSAGYGLYGLNRLPYAGLGF